MHADGINCYGKCFYEARHKILGIGDLEAEALAVLYHIDIVILD